MGFLIRIGFWLGLVLVLIPRSGESSTSILDAISPMQLFNTTTGIVGDLAGLCDRQPDVCESAGEIFHVLSLRAKEGAAIAYDAISSATRQQDRPEQPETAEEPRLAVPLPESGASQQ